MITTSQPGRTPAYSLVLTGKSFFVLNRKDVDVEKLNIGAGDIVIYCIRYGSKKVAGYTHGQIRGLVYDGKKLRQVYLWTFVNDLSLFVKYLPKNDASLLEPIVEKLSKAIADNKENDVLYKGGYFLKVSTWDLVHGPAGRVRQKKFLSWRVRGTSHPLPSQEYGSMHCSDRRSPQ